MIIKQLITQQEYETLLNIQKTNTILTFQNYGYEYVDKNKFDQSDKIAFDIVTSILKKTIAGFSEFNNFRLSKNKEMVSEQLIKKYNNSIINVISRTQSLRISPCGNNAALPQAADKAAQHCGGKH